MNSRIVSVIACAMLLLSSSGCCNLKQFWFGRGAKCGLCPSASAPLIALPNTTAPAPYAPQQPVYVAPPQPTYTQPQQPIYIAPQQPRKGCGLFHRGRSNAPRHSQPICSGPSCQTPAHGQQIIGECCPPCGCGHGHVSGGCYESCHQGWSSSMDGCECESGSHGPVLHDPYLSGAVIDGSSMHHDGQIIDGRYSGEQIISDRVIGSGTTGMSDDFDARGDRIISVEPLPPGNSPGR